MRLPPDGHWATIVDFLTEITGAPRAELLARASGGEIRLAGGGMVSPDTAYRGGGVVYLYREVRPEPVVPFDLDVLYRDDDIIVVDKPPFLATMPRGRHVTQTVVTRLRRDMALADVAPAHRLDRLTSGVLLLTLRPAARAAYQTMFARGEVTKSYLALAPLSTSLAEPLTVANRIVKDRGQLQARVVPGEPNAITIVQLLEARGDLGLYKLRPHTGKTHQLRVHCCGLAIPIRGDCLYPVVRDVPADDFSDPLRLLAQRLEFDDPLTGELRVFTSRRSVDHG
ncbi:MAG: pseudouridine synthase [Ornithinimicrobium sp.]